MIRPATESDIPALVAMGQKFSEAAGTPFDKGDVAEFVSALIGSENGAVFVTDGGMIGGVLSPAYSCKSWLMAVELFWWAEDRQGIRLLKAFEEWAASRGASEIRMTTLAAIDGPQKIMARRGYAPIEISYQKVM